MSGMIEYVLADAAERHSAQVASDIEWYAFPQVWGSTALGFGGMGGQMITTAQTFIVIGDSEAYVYFGGRYAYTAGIGEAREWALRHRAPGKGGRR